MSHLTCNRCPSPGVTVFRKEALCGRCAALVAAELLDELAYLRSQTPDQVEPDGRHPLAPGQINRKHPWSLPVAG